MLLDQLLRLFRSVAGDPPIPNGWRSSRPEENVLRYGKLRSQQ